MGGAPAETGGDYPVDLTSAWEEIRRAGCTERGVGFGDPPPPIWAKYEYNLPTSFYQECLPAPSPPPPPVSPGTVVLSAKIETDEPAGGFAASGRIKLISGLQATGGGANVSAAMATLWSAVDLETGLPFNLTGRLSTPATDRNLVIAPCALEMSKSCASPAGRTRATHGRASLACCAWLSLRSTPHTDEFTLSTWIPRGERIPEEWAAAAATNATVVVSTRTAPSGGSLVVSPTSGVALSTDFTLQAADWASPYSGTTYTYSFAYVAGSGGAALAQGECSPGAVGLKTLSAAQAADSVIRTLPAGNHTLTVVVTDSHGASPCSCTSVAIEVLPVAVSASVATATVDTAAGLIADDPSAGAAYLAPLTDSLNEDSSSLTKEEVEQVREDVTALLADAATTLQTAAEDPGGAAADSALVDQLSSALKSAVATTDQVSNRSVDSGADSLAALMGARKDEGVSDSAKQNVIEATSSLLTATVGIGAEDAASREQVTSLFAKLTPLLSQLADKMRDTAVVGEVATASSPAAAAATRAATPDTLVGEYTAAPFTGGASPGSMTIPDGIGEALGSPTLIDVSLITSTINPHQGEADETTGTQLFDIKFAADGGGASSLQALASPLVLAVPLAAPSSPAGAACTADSGCNAPLGACTGGVCACEPEYGNCTDTCDCGTELACTFWDDAASAWSDYGVTTLGVGDDNALSCESNHTTEFAGVYFPTSASAWASDVPVPALPCSGGWVWLWGSGGFWSTWGEHSTVYITIFSVLGANVLLLPLFRMRYHLRFRKAREKLAKGIRLNRVVKPWTRNSTTSTVEPSCSTALTEASESKPKKEKPAKKVRPKKEKTPKKQQVAPYDPGAQVATTAHESSELYSFDDAEISAMAEASGQLAMSPPRASVDYKGEAGGRRPSLDELRIKGASSSSLIRMEDNLEAQAAAGRAHAAFEGEAGSNRSLDDMPSSKASPSGKRLMKQKSNCDSGRLDTAAVSPPPSPPARVGKGKAAFASGGLLRGMSGKTGPAVSSTTDAVTPRQVAAITAVQAVARGNATRAGKQNWQHVQRAATLRDVSGKGKKKGERSTCRAKAAQGEWSMASVARNAMSRHSIVQGARNTGKRSVEHVRDRHTLVSVTNPLDVNVEEQMHLRDEQLCQLFFHALVWELVMCCVWVRAVTITSGGSLHVRNMLIVGFSTAFTQIIVVLFTRLIFRIGNRAIYRAKVQGAERRKKANVVWALCWAFNLGTLLAMAYVTLAYAYGAHSNPRLRFCCRMLSAAALLLCTGTASVTARRTTSSTGGVWAWASHGCSRSRSSSLSSPSCRRSASASASARALSAWMTRGSTPKSASDSNKKTGVEGTCITCSGVLLSSI